MSLNKRLLIVLAAFSVVLFVLPLRLFYLQVIEHEFYLSRSIDQRTRVIVLAADRGDILDRNGNILATSVDTYSVFVIPKKIKNKEYMVQQIVCCPESFSFRRYVIAHDPTSFSPSNPYP